MSNVQNMGDGCASSNNTMLCDLVTKIPPNVNLNCGKKAHKLIMWVIIFLEEQQ
jgi:hypothetical protein